MRDPVTFTLFTSCDSRTLEKKDVPPTPPWLMSQRISFLLLLLPLLLLLLLPLLLVSGIYTCLAQAPISGQRGTL